MVKHLQAQPKTLFVFIAAVLSLGFNHHASKILTASYERSLFPVSYFEAQLSYSAEKIKRWYAYLIEQNTLDIYVQTQHIDFIFMLSILMLHFFVLLLVSRLFKDGSKDRKWMVVFAMVSAVAPLADAAENLVSYIMLAQPGSFPNWLVYIYSGFATLKFTMFVFAYLTATIGFFIGLYTIIRNKFRLTNSFKKPVLH